LINIQYPNFTLKGAGYRQELHNALKWNKNGSVGIVRNQQDRRPMNNIIRFPTV